MKLTALVRSILFWFVFAVSILIAGFILLTASLFSSSKERCYDIVRGWCKWIIQAMGGICNVKFSFENMDSIKNMGPVVLLSKHQSGWETLALFGFVPRRVSFVYKRELHKLPVFGWGLASLGMLSIDRRHGKAPFEHIKEEAPKYFEKGWAIVLFPEGTRTKPGQTVKYKSGGARIAIDTGTPVVPIALNSGRCWPKGSFIIYPGHIQVIFGPEIRPEGKTVAQLNDEVQNWIETQMKVIDKP